MAFKSSVSSSMVTAMLCTVLLMAAINSVESFSIPKGTLPSIVERKQGCVFEYQRQSCRMAKSLHRQEYKSTSRAQLYQSSDNNGNDNMNRGAEGTDTLGTRRGIYVILVVLAFNIWQFSIPVEFRRTRFCSEQQVRLYPESNCKTFKQWQTGIVDYYKAGGGIEWDFSIEK